jgi:ketosteroid isomerase-like protein
MDTLGMDDPRISVMKRVFDKWATRDLAALSDLAHPQILAALVLPPGNAKREYRGRGEIEMFLEEGAAKYERFEAEANGFAIGPSGRVFAEGSVSYRVAGAKGLTSAAYWVCDVRDGKIAAWESFSDRLSARLAAGFEA